MIEFVESPDDYSWKGYCLAVLLLVNNVLKAVLLQYYLRAAVQTGFRIRTAVINAVYLKVQCISLAVCCFIGASRMADSPETQTLHQLG